MRSSLIGVIDSPRWRERHQATRATIDQPTPISNRLAPVMLARASEHGDAVSLPAAAHRLPNSATACPALLANTKSTAYSGSTAMSARSATASPAEMSTCAASAPHERMNAAPTMASPNRTASAGWGMSGDVTRRAIAGTVTSAASTNRSCERTGWTVSSSVAVAVTTGGA